MRISSSSVQLSATHQKTIKEEERTSMRLSVGSNTQTVETVRARGEATRDQVDISTVARDVLALAEKTSAEEPKPEEVSELSKAEETAEDPAETPQLKLYRMVVETLMRTQIKTAAVEIDEDAASRDEEKLTAAARDAERTAGGHRERTIVARNSNADFALAYDYSYEYAESEHTSFTAVGVVNTQDGKQIELAVAVSMQREYRESESLHVRAGNVRLKDPLVLQFAGEAGQLQQGTFAFDIDADGALDNVHMLAPSSAALAIDHNQNGQIDDGSELLGTSSGDGFAELAKFDADKSGWIDEGDPVFERLRLWSQSKDGASSLSSLGDRGVGAIYLGRASTPFEIKDARNQLQGVVRASGVWLRDDGTPGVAQQIDLKA